jgi:hypothetical protein
MNKLTDDRLREIEDIGTETADELNGMITVIRLLRAECQAWRELQKIRVSGTDAQFCAAYDLAKAAEKATGPL